MAGTTAREVLGDVSLATMRRRHLRQVLAIERAVYPRPWTPTLFAAELAKTDTRSYLVALARGGAEGPGRRVWRRRVVVGYGGVLVQVGEAHITTVAVHPAHHRRKVATRLVAALLRESRQRGARAATLEVRATNRGAQRLYAAFGFVPAGVRPRYYTETGEDALVMWLHDLDGPEAAERIALQEERLSQPGGASGEPDYPVPWVEGRVGLEERD